MKKLSELNDALKAYHGGGARLWDFSPTHDRLVIALTNRSKERREYLTLIGCTDLHLPTMWEIVAPTLDGESPAFVFSDNDVNIVFAHEYQLAQEYHR